MFNRKQLIKIIKARKRKNYKYLYENSLKLNMLCFSKLEKLKQFDLVSTIADFNDCSNTNECDDLLKDKNNHKKRIKTERIENE